MGEVFATAIFEAEDFIFDPYGASGRFSGILKISPSHCKVHFMADSTGRSTAR